MAKTQNIVNKTVRKGLTTLINGFYELEEIDKKAALFYLKRMKHQLDLLTYQHFNGILDD